MNLSVPGINFILCQKNYISFELLQNITRLRKKHTCNPFYEPHNNQTNIDPPLNGYWSPLEYKKVWTSNVNFQEFTAHLRTRARFFAGTETRKHKSSRKKLIPFAKLIRNGTLNAFACNELMAVLPPTDGHHISSHTKSESSSSCIDIANKVFFARTTKWSTEEEEDSVVVTLGWH